MKKFLPILLLAGLVLASFTPLARAGGAGPRLGLQSWTCRNMTFDEVVAFAGVHQIKYLQLIAKHIDPNGPREETLRKKAILDQHGLVCYTFGVNGTSMDKEQNRKLFEFAKLMGIQMIVVEPRAMAEWDNLEALVKEYDIKLAIHNHGKGTVYGDPATVSAILAARDPRIGVCLDIGWITAAGFDAAKVFAGYGDRVFDMHLKDKRVDTSGETPVILDVEIGTGDANYQGLFAEIKKAHWAGVMAIETDNAGFAADPNRLVKEAAIFFKTHAAR